MKCFRNALLRRLMLVVAIVLMIAAGAWAAIEWTNVEAGSAVEAALYRWMPMPVSKVMGLRPPREAQPLITDLIRKQPSAELYSLRALNEEAALDFTAAESDWKKHAETAADKTQAQLALAHFYGRRLRPADEVTALMVVGRASTDAREKLLAPDQQSSWRAFEQSLKVAREGALPAEVTDQTYRAWITRYPDQKTIYARYFQFLLDRKSFDAVEKLIAQYHSVFPGDDIFPVKARALLEYKKGSVEQGLAVYDAHFQPLWPEELIQSYFELMTETRSVRKFFDRARAALDRNPDDLNSAARIFYYYQRQGRADAAQQTLADYRLHKEQRNAKWSSEELYTLARLHEGIHAYPEAARYYYALYNATDKSDSPERALAGLARILLEAPEQGIRLGSGELSMYRDIATADTGPGFLNGILSLVLNTTNPPYQYSEEEQRAVPYFHRAQAAELVRLLDSRFPQSAERPALHARLMETYATYGESAAVIRDGQQFLSAFPNSSEREQVALLMADAYARTKREQEEFALYDNLLAELAKKAEGVPLGAEATEQTFTEEEARPEVESAEAEGEEGEAEQPAMQVQRKPRRAFAVPAGKPESTVPGLRSPEYSRVLERYLSRLVSTGRVPQALQVLRNEIVRNPNDPGLYERLAQFLAQNRLGAQQEEVYQRAIQQFQDRSWYHKLARFYLRERRNADFQRLSEQVIKIFSGTDLEHYFQDVVDSNVFYIDLNQYAHSRFPHDMVFVRNLLAAYRADTPRWEQLLREHWWEAEDLRNHFFEFLSRTGRLDQELATLQQTEASAQAGRWPELAAANPVAARFIGEAGFWRSHYEEAAPIIGALAQQYPADAELGQRASAAYRSLAAFDPKNTELAVGIEQNLYNSNPGDRQELARIGDIFADRELFERAAPYWNRMAQVRPGEPQAYLDPATVYWDYYNFDAALRLLNEGRARLSDSTLYSYEEGAIYENERDYPAAVAQYLAGALKEVGDGRSRSRLLELARRPKLRDAVEKATAALGEGATPDQDRVNLRLAILDAENRPKEVESFLSSLAGRSNSLELLEWVEGTARQRSLVAVQQSALERQASVTSDPIRRLELRYSLVTFYEAKKDLASAQRNVEALYRENPKILGVVRATVDFYWRNQQKQRAIDVLTEAAANSYPALRTQFTFEEARKMTDAGQYDAARKLLTRLLAESPYNAEYLAATADTYARAGNDQGLKAFYLQKIDDFRKAPLPPDDRTRQIAALRRGLIPSLTRLKDYAGAVDQYVEIINKFPEDDALVTEAALYAQGHSRQPQLLNFYSNTVKQSPRDYRWPMVLARMQTQLEDYPAAIESYGTAINVRPDRVDLRTARADLLERLMRFDEAAADYQRLFELNYHDTHWMEKVAEIRARQSKAPETVAALQAALVENRPEKPENYFEVARRLESWGMLEQARDFAIKGVDSAGRELLAMPEHHNGAALYAHIMTRLRQQDVAYQRLRKAVADASSLTASLGVAVQQIEKQGVLTVSDQQWRQRAMLIRLDAARAGMGAAMQSMGNTVNEYFTPEEKLLFATELQKQAATADLRDIESIFLPAAKAAQLGDLQARWTESLMPMNFATNAGRYQAELIELQSHRMRFHELGASLERYAQSLRVNFRDSVLFQAADAYHAGAEPDQELRVLSQVVSTRFPGNVQERYFGLLLQRQPQELLQWAASGFPATQYAVLHGDSGLALQAVAARARSLPPVWNTGYSALTALYFADRSPTVKTNFVTTLGDATIGERIGKPVDRQRQLAGNVWFYYGSRYGEWLGLTGSSEGEDFLPAILEQSPASASGYVTLGEYYADAGKLDRAIQDYGHTLELAPGRADIHERMAMLYWRQQKRVEAVAEWKQALEMLDTQVTQRKVPPTLWDTLQYSLNHIGNRHLLAELRPQADTVLRDYIRFNGEYRVDNLLREAFNAVGDPQAATTWMLDLATVAPDPTAMLRRLIEARWIPASARDPIYQQLLSRLQDRLRSTQGLSEQYAEQDLRSWQLRYARYLIEQNQFDRADVILQALPKQPPSSDELELRMRVALARNEFDSIVQQYRAAPEQAPPAAVLREVARSLQTAGLVAPARKLMEFVFTQGIAAHQLTAANLLGLAEIRLQDGDIAGALELLRRLTLVVGQPFENLDAAGSLLARTGHHAEAADFLLQLVKASPWDTNARFRLALEQFAAGRDPAAATATTIAVASSRQTKYRDRWIAANALSGQGGEFPSLGSAELDLIARSANPSATEADRPYFYEARMRAAAASAPEVRAQLLRNAVSDSPQRDSARVPLFYTLVSHGQHQLAVSALQPVLRANVLFANTPRYRDEVQPEETPESAEDETAPESGPEPDPVYARPRRNAGELARMSAADRAALALAVGNSYVALEQYDKALSYLQSALRLEKSPPKRAQVQQRITAVRSTMRRNATNLLRAPTIHSELEQEHVVRPRLVAASARTAPAKPTATKGGSAQ